MEISGQSERPNTENPFTTFRGLLTFIVLVSGWSLYSMLRHMSTRFGVPRHFVGQFLALGHFGPVFDVCSYLLFAWFFVSIFQWGRDRAERIWAACWIAPILINPLKMLIPRYSYMVWWAELFLELVFFLATIALFLNWKPGPPLARCRARFSAVPEPRMHQNHSPRRMAR
jgi:hypothetical protein